MKYIVTLNNTKYEIEVENGEAYVKTKSTDAPTAAPAAAPQPQKAQAAGDNAVAAPMPGTVLKILVQPGDKVKAGQNLIILEAMKMENEILAPRDATVGQINVSVGANVATGDVLLQLD
ncbi:MAG TPA: acetyl-CoA carboxylase biotin carboxyl carrier protein subunit [Clostridia bacterium]|nr:acetyl-CoA carboxylase biotin carboxyl carrier protein subunit [Clostridia bacterium]